MRRQSLGIWSAFFLAALLFIGSAAAAYHEILPYLIGGRDTESKRRALLIEPLPIGLSLQAQRLALDDCLQALSPLVGAAPTDDNAKVAANCRVMAQDIVRQSPVFSYGWYILALAYSVDGADQDFQDALSLSQATTANQWAMASLRLWLGYQYWVELAPALRQQLGLDIQVLATTGDGRRWLADGYQRSEAFKEDVISNLEKTPADIQRAFLSALSQSGAAK